MIRVGFGMFYDRFSLGNILTARRYDGVVQQQYVVTDPDFFPTVPPASSLAGYFASGTIQQISSSLRAPYLMQTAAGFERQLPLNTTVALTFANSHGLHMLRSQDINAPIPGTGIYPRGRPGLVALMESSGLYNQNQFIVNVNSKVNRDISLQGSYGYSHAMSNTDGLGTFPAKPYSMEGEYGPAGTDIHHRVSLGGTVTARWGIRFNPLLTANTGPPFDITTGQDLYGDTLFNDRPAIATNPNKPGIVRTPYGLLDPNPSPDQKPISRNYGQRPGADHAQHAGRPDLQLRRERHDAGGGLRASLRPDRFHADPQPDEPQQPRADHRQHHLPAVRPGQSTRRIWQRHLLRKRQQQAAGTTDEVYFLTNGRFRMSLDTSVSDLPIASPATGFEANLPELERPRR